VADYGRDLDIGYPSETTLKDIYIKLGDVGIKIDNSTDSIEETLDELKKVSLGVGLVTGIDLNEEDIE